MPKPKKPHPTDARVRELLRWCRNEKIVLHRVVVGDVELELADTQLAGKLSERKSSTEADAKADLYKQYAGPLYNGTPTDPSREVVENMQDAEDGDD